MKAKGVLSRRKPVYFTLASDYEKRMASVEAAHRRSRAELGREWVQERLDVMDFPCLEFRSNSQGRFAVVRGTRLAIWQIALLARKLGWGLKLAKHLEVSPEVIRSAEGYYQRHNPEIEALIDANENADFETMKGKFPRLRRMDEASG